jgi:SAM-dependent methyltransferase
MSSYVDWHAKPGYWGDVVRHFDRSSRLLDIGCGSGWIADHFDNYIGLETDLNAVAIAEAAGRDVRHIDAGSALPFSDPAFDGVVMKDLLEHVADPAALVLEVRRVLVAGGRVFASAPDAQRWVWEDYTHRRPFPLKALRRLFVDHGFEIVDSGYESVMPGASVVSGLTRKHRRPIPLRLIARTRAARRNSWVVARRVG